MSQSAKKRSAILLPFGILTLIFITEGALAQEGVLATVFEQRKDLDHGRLVVSSIYKNHITDMTNEIKFDLVFKGEKLRSYRDSQKLSIVNVFGGHRGQVVHILESSSNESPAIQIISPEDALPTTLEHMTPDPRYLGLLTAPFHETAMFRDTWQQIFSSSDSHPYTEQDVILDGQNCLKCSYVNTSGIRLNFWLSKKDHNKILKVSCHDVNEVEEENGSVIEVENQKIAFSKLNWFPKRVRCYQYNNGQLAYSEDLQVEKVSFGRVSDREFTIGKLRNIRVGQPVLWRSDLPRPCESGQLFWDGSQVTCSGRIDQPSNRDGIPWIGTAIAFAAAALVLFSRL